MIDKARELDINYSFIKFISESCEDFPHRISPDPFVLVNRPEKKAERRQVNPMLSSPVLTEDSSGRKFLYDDLDLELIKKLQVSVIKAVEDYRVEFEKKYLKSVLSYKVEISQDNFKQVVDWLSIACPNLEKDYVIKQCEERWNNKY